MRQNPCFIAILLFLQTIVLPGCSSRLAIGRPVGPVWLEHLPERDGFLYAIGSCPKTHHPTDARKNALEDARLELAKSIEISIKSVSLTELSSASDSVEYYEVAQTAIDQALKNSEVEAFWTDREGAIGLKDTVYVLIRVRKPTPRSSTP